MKHVETRIEELSRRLQADLLAFNGKLPGPAPAFRRQLLIPVAIIVGGALLLSVSPRARKNMLLQVAMTTSARLLWRSAG